MLSPLRPWLVVGSVLAAIGLTLEYDLLLGVPALIGIPALALSLLMRGRSIEPEAARLALPASIPPAVAELLIELEILTTEFAADPNDIDVLNRIGFWLEREATLSPDAHAWLRQRGASAESIKGARERLLTIVSEWRSRIRQRKAEHELHRALVAFGKVTERADHSVDPYR